MMDSLAATERAKYVTMWAREDYRRNSPGLNVAPRAVELMGAKGGTLNDYGCGEGRALDWFRHHGLEARGIDIVALREDVIEACLWDMAGKVPVSHYAFCADVLEHIPEPKVPDVLRAIHARTEFSGAFTVATVPCTCGQRAGLTLHETVKPVEWWDQHLSALWDRVEHHHTDREWRHLFVVSKPRRA